MIGFVVVIVFRQNNFYGISSLERMSVGSGLAALNFMKRENTNTSENFKLRTR